MKKFFFALSMFMMVGVAANAQACTKSAKAKCCAKKAAAAKADASTTSTTQVAAAIAEADIAADADETIQTRVCEKSGSKSYYQKSTCAMSGSVSWAEVEYCSKSKAFSTKVASASMEKDVNTGEVKKMEKKSCAKKCAKGAKACTKKVGTE